MVRSRIASALLATASIALPVVLGEVACRLAGYRGVEMYRPDGEPRWRHTLRPSLADAHIRVPAPINEPVRPYGPGSPEKASLKARLADLSDARTSIPMVINGTPVSAFGGGK